MLIAQLSDLHVPEEGAVFSGSIDPGERLRQAIALLNDMKPKASALLITGDLVETGTRSEYAHLRLVLDSVEDIPVYLLPGNRDDRRALRDVFHEHDYFFSENRLFFRIEFDDAQIIGLDTAVDHESHGALDDAQLEWLDGVLSADRRPALVAMHHPPLMSHLGMMDQWCLRGMEALAGRLQPYDHIRLITCGHLHRAVSTRFANIRLNVCPSTTFSIGLELYQKDRLSWCDEGGAFQIHDWTNDDVVTWTLPCQSVRRCSFSPSD